MYAATKELKTAVAFLVILFGFDSQRHHQWIAHLVEQLTNNQCVAGSIPVPEHS